MATSIPLYHFPREEDKGRVKGRRAVGAMMVMQPLPWGRVAVMRGTGSSTGDGWRRRGRR